MFNTQLLSAGLPCVGGSAGSGVAAAMATRWADKRPEEGEEREKEEKLACWTTKGEPGTPSGWEPEVLVQLRH